MSQLGFPLLSIIVWLPALGALLLLLVPRTNDELSRRASLGVSTLTFAISCALPALFNPALPEAAAPAMQFVDQIDWIPSWGISYNVGLDGVSLWLVLLTTFITPITVLSTWDSVHKQVRAFQILMLLLETAMIGVFVAQDLFLFYIFWEFTLIPMAFMIGIWGSENRIYAAVKFFLYTFAGSVLMLVAIIALYILHRDAIAATTPGYVGTFDFGVIAEHLRSGSFVLEAGLAQALFGAFFLAFAIKTPMWPFHTWLPDAHVQAPTAGSVILAGVLLKLGTYGMIRFNLTLFPDASLWAAPAIGILAVIGIIYGAMTAYAQTDMKKLVAYSSVSHMGFVVLGIFALNQIGVSGALIQMINHGLSTGALFLLVGVIYERRHTREIGEFGGLWKVMPIYGGVTLLVVLSSAGLPGLNGFIGEFAIMQGAFMAYETGGARILGWPFVAFAVLGVILAAVYLLRMYGGAFMGDVGNPENAQLSDLSRREIVVLGLLCVPIIAIGLFPNLLFAPMETSVADVLHTFTGVVAGR